MNIDLYRKWPVVRVAYELCIGTRSGGIKFVGLTGGKAVLS